MLKFSKEAFEVLRFQKSQVYPAPKPLYGCYKTFHWACHSDDR